MDEETRSATASCIVDVILADGRRRKLSVVHHLRADRYTVRLMTSIGNVEAQWSDLDPTRYHDLLDELMGRC
jgi:CelD/BcsL family acetyltransferase involved in cellulose biosynthesis